MVENTTYLEDGERKKKRKEKKKHQASKNVFFFYQKDPEQVLSCKTKPKLLLRGRVGGWKCKKP